jgi:hypothetical protein
LDRRDHASGLCDNQGEGQKVDRLSDIGGILRGHNCREELKAKKSTGESKRIKE